MDITEKKKQANRENGKLGGVKTDEGKAISSLNSLKHGILSHALTSYDWVDVQEVYDRFAGEFDDSTPSRKVLIEQLAITYVRLCRCLRYETEALKAVLNPPVYETIEIEKPTPGFEFNFDMGSPGKYETRLVRDGDTQTIPGTPFTETELITLRYEPQLLARFMKILEMLKTF